MDFFLQKIATVKNRVFFTKSDAVFCYRSTIVITKIRINLVHTHTHTHTHTHNTHTHTYIHTHYHYVYT